MPEYNPLADFALDYSSGLPVWVQLRNRIAYLVRRGSYAIGDQLPTVRKLAVDLDISYNTVNRAYMDLERDGYIHTRKGRGTFVAEMLSDSDNSEDLANLVVDDMIKSCQNTGMAADEILELVRSRLQLCK